MAITPWCLAAARPRCTITYLLHVMAPEMIGLGLAMFWVHQGIDRPAATRLPSEGETGGYCWV